MKRYIQTKIEVEEFSELPLLKRARPIELAYIGYGLLVVISVAASYLIGLFKLLPYAADDMDLDLILSAPGASGHILGTDFMGRDILTRLVMGIQAYFLPGLLAVSISLIVGSVLGVLAGYRGGRFDTVVTYFTNLIDSFPRLVLILLMVAAFKPDIYYIMAIVGITNIPAVALLIKGKIQYLKQKNFIEAATSLGLSTRAIIFKHIIWYNCRAVLIIQATLGMAEAILVETSLSYLGFGVQEPTPSWGNMVQAGTNYFMQGKFWPSTAPALAIMLTILGFHLLGDGLTSVLERKRNR